LKHILPLVSYYKKNYCFDTTKHFLPWRFGLNQRPSSEEACSVLPVLTTIEMWRGKKSVVHVAQRVAALVSVQGSSSLFPNMCCFFDPLSTFVWFPIHAEPYVQQISCHVTFLSWQEPEEDLKKLLLMKVSGSVRNVKAKNVWLCWSNLRGHLHDYLGYPMIPFQPTLSKNWSHAAVHSQTNINWVPLYIIITYTIFF